ncbi:uncharacterized protein KNAG_0H03430 [Huiozyma naganishii CBS 8797]|uniref:phosphoinositide 5-phosphatase n=1 Tax=Huiozyma naganishii (strain ATCC MYA-139 / BCRC 22969 / CBS 8797 / KCTC 17520 / NBRC 10181 / NCYC 3082 / Yp74L-3) TaxID=1071383 RepID=J7S204_HUIN7|nr:hypothetical protein KNAG_0H03430 [Kazachstania naganishii CBS 8797]CCK71757.1 hypothetical protein KNAG_0H03430 [Kazachstania naganishii CBS 8797]
MNILVSDKPDRRIAIVSRSYALILKSVKNSDASQSKKPYCAIELVSKSAVQGQDFVKLSANELYGFVGLIEIEGLIFLGAITGKAKVAQPIPGETVNKILTVDFFCLNDASWDFLEIDSSGYPLVPETELSVPGSGSDFQQQQPNDLLPKHPCFELKKLMSNGSFYYSSDFDLTSTLQSRGFGAHSLSADNYEAEYMWNSFLMEEIVTYRDRLDNHAKQILDDEGFLTTVIRGFAETFATHVMEAKVTLTMISKQSWKRAGTRFNARGVDDDANVANFVETELIFYSREYCYAFTEIRGSIPVFWEQDTSLINPKVQITRSIDATQPIFDKHFQRSIEKYGPVHVVNLLSTKSSEIELSQRYRDHLTRSKKLRMNDDVFYTWFDFHKETAQEGFSGVRKVLPLIRDSMLCSGYYAYDVQARKIISEQHGIFRTNCLDCLDRTNLAQQAISLAGFRIFLEDLKFITSNTYIDDDDFVNKHNTLWADNGDQISQIYTGTNALKSSFSRKGKMSLAGALSDATKSVSRMYINNFMDKGKQQNIDTLLGRLPHQQPVQLYDPVNEYVTSQLDTMSDQFTSYSTINIFVGSFNVNGTTQKTDLSSWLFPIGDKFRPDIVVLGLQEVIELTAGSILNADYSKGSFWENMVSDCLNQYHDKYLLLRVEQMSSLLILFFVKSDKAKCVKQVEGATKKTGFGGMTGNKGAVSIRFKYNSTSFCFVNMHLSAGVANVDDRRNDYESILNGISFTRSNTISNHDSIFWLGDTNYRINLRNEEVRKELKSGKESLTKLFHYDQLAQEMKSGAVFQGFNEPDVKFQPTYKYDNGTNTYDSSEKARTPSWTDRIVYKGTNLHPLAYSDAPLLISDHKPIYGAYRAKVKSTNDEEKVKLTKQLFEKYKVMHPDETSSLNSQLLNLGLEGGSNDILSRELPSTIPSSVSLLDMGTESSVSPLKQTPTSLSPSQSVSSIPISNSILQPRRNPSVTAVASPPAEKENVSSASILDPAIAKPNSTNAFRKPLLRPPPPPAFGDTNVETNGNKPRQENIPSVRPHVGNTKPQQSANVSKSVVKNTAHFSSPPPGFTSSMVLTPKNAASGSQTSSTPGPSVSPATKPPTDGISQLTKTNLDGDRSSSQSTSVAPAAHSMDSWQPLQPK